jgi:hypothetical protein
MVSLIAGREVHAHCQDRLNSQYVALGLAQVNRLEVAMAGFANIQAIHTILAGIVSQFAVLGIAAERTLHPSKRPFSIAARAEKRPLALPPKGGKVRLAAANRAITTPPLTQVKQGQDDLGGTF